MKLACEETDSNIDMIKNSEEGIVKSVEDVWNIFESKIIKLYILPLLKKFNIN